MDAMEKRFADLCLVGLGMDDDARFEAMAVFRECRPGLEANLAALGCGQPEEIERHWSACALFCVTKLREEKTKSENKESRIVLTQILKATNITFAGFFREIPQFLPKTGHILSTSYGSDWEKRLGVKELQANFVHLRILSDHYKCAYEEFFLSSSINGDSCSTGSLSAGFLSEYHQFGWLLFLALRVHAFSRFRDLVTGINGLVAILAVLILHVPVQMRKFSISDSTRLVKKSAKGVDLLASLCNIHETTEAVLKAAIDQTNTLIIDILKKKPLPASECHAETLTNIDTDGLTYFEDLMKDGSLQSSVLILEKDYDDAVQTKGEIDERILVGNEDSLLGTGSLSGGAISIRRPKGTPMESPAKTVLSPMSPPRSPASPANGGHSGNIRIIATPVSTAMTTAKWLRTVISVLPARPSKELEVFLSSCDKDVTSDVIYRANLILEAIFRTRSFNDRCVTGTLQKADSMWVEQRKLEALKLYYRVLESMCRAESHTLHGNNLTSLLSNERFHRCVLACSAELVIATHKAITMMFPTALEKAGITAFDLSKVIESFVLHEKTLPRELKRHLNSLEERLLESLAWKKGSSMYNSLIIARPALASEINRMGLLPEPMPSLDEIAAHHNIPSRSLPTLQLQKRENSPEQNREMRSPKRLCMETRSVLVERNSFTSPVKDRLQTDSSQKFKLPYMHSAFATPTRPSPVGGGETCAETGINIFFSKIIKLASARIKNLCEKMQLPIEIKERVYCFVQQILNHRTSLFFERHIDQIILCSFYGVAKISHLPLTFKEIINNYRKQTQCKTEVFRSVFVDWSLIGHNEKMGQELVDIITFYNAVFIPSVKPLLVEIGPTGSTMKSNRNSEDTVDPRGQGPESPRFSRFPSLPDMSPKKVSASHNVYVSPLRSSKMDTYLSPSSTSYYAFLGESTHAYQSPSKDLTAINNRLNCNKRKKLSFDLVSDSQVAGSLCPQNGTSIPSSAAPTTSKTTVKTEQPDCA